VKAIFLIYCAFLLLQGVAAQEGRNGTGYLIPQTVFVGDPGRLAVPLGPDFLETRPFVFQNPEGLPRTKDLVISRMEKENRNGVPWLFIDFTAYAPGLVEIPSLVIPGPLGKDARISGLTVSIASILSPSSRILSDPAPPLAVPGTSLIIYGVFAGILVAVFLGIGANFWGKPCLRGVGDRWRRRRLIRSMERIVKRLRGEVLRGKYGPGKSGEILSLLSGELRNFLSFLTGVNCRTLTAGEFQDFPLFSFSQTGEIPGNREPSVEKAVSSAGNREPASGASLSPSFLEDMFRRCDTLRFSGDAVGREKLLGMLDDAQALVTALAEAGGRKRGSEPEKAALSGKGAP
jgi:hypothetical protein